MILVTAAPTAFQKVNIFFFCMCVRYFQIKIRFCLHITYPSVEEPRESVQKRQNWEGERANLLPVTSKQTNQIC